MGCVDSVGRGSSRRVCESIDAAEKLFVRVAWLRSELLCSAGGDALCGCDHDGGCRGSVAMVGGVEGGPQREGRVEYSED